MISEDGFNPCVTDGILLGQDECGGWTGDWEFSCILTNFVTCAKVQSFNLFKYLSLVSCHISYELVSV